MMRDGQSSFPNTNDKRLPSKRDLRKLATKEDKHHVHKTLGVLALVHFLYRFSWPSGMGFDTQPLSWTAACLSVHLLLSCSSLLFRVHPKRGKSDRPMIWSEFRAHSILFAARAILATWVHALHAHGAVGASSRDALCALIVMLTMCAADMITRALGAGTRTIRDMPVDASASDASRRLGKKFQSLRQFGATMSVCSSANAAFSTLLAIQGAALLMTLCRKSIISPRQWHVGYNGMLFATGLMYHYVPSSDCIGSYYSLSCMLATTAYSLRTDWGFNKYLVWSLALSVWVGRAYIPFPPEALVVAALFLIAAGQYRPGSFCLGSALGVLGGGWPGFLFRWAGATHAFLEWLRA